MLAIVGFNWESRDKIQKLDEENYEKLRTISQLNLPERGQWYYQDNVLIDLETDGVLLVSLGIDFQIRLFKNTYKTPSNVTNHSLHVHIPNIGLLSINEVRLLENACTDSLQNLLDDGWRIVAVCPPNGVRRPDYILGRTRETQ